MKIMVSFNVMALFTPLELELAKEFMTALLHSISNLTKSIQDNKRKQQESSLQIQENFLTPKSFFALLDNRSAWLTSIAKKGFRVKKSSI